MFTTVFSLFGSWSPDLWLVVARAGAIAVGRAGLPAWRGALGGGVVGGVAAACALAIAPWWIRNAALGNSRGADRRVPARRDRPAPGRRPALGLLAGGLRGPAAPRGVAVPGVYGLFLLWTRVAARGSSSSARASASWRCGCCRSGGARATCCAPRTAPRTSTRARRPTPTTRRASVLDDAGDMLTGPLMVGLVARRRHGDGQALAGRSRALIAMAIAWLGLVAYMTSDGFSGNQRYLIAPVALLIVLGRRGTAGRWAGLALVPRAVPRLRAAAAGRRRARRCWPRSVVGVGFAAPSFQRFATDLRGLKYQAELADELPGPDPRRRRRGRAEGAAATPTPGRSWCRSSRGTCDLHTEQVAAGAAAARRSCSASRPRRARGRRRRCATSATAPRWRRATSGGS